MPEVTKRQIWEYLSNGGPDYDSFGAFREQATDELSIDQAAFEALKGCDLRQIVADSEMSECHLGGDDLVSMADDVLAAVKDGYAVATWYGPDSEALVVGYRPDQLTVINGRR